MPPHKPIVLVVTEDRKPSAVISAGCGRTAGHDRLPWTPGPSYVCAGGRGEPRPLAVDADVVVLDLWLASDTMLTGTPALQLLASSTSLGKPVVGLEHPAAPAASVRRRRRRAGPLAAGAARCAGPCAVGWRRPRRAIYAPEPRPRGGAPQSIRELYHRGVLTAYPDETVTAAAGRMQQEAVGSLAVVEEGRLVAIVTERDLVALEAWLPGDPAKT